MILQHEAPFTAHLVDRLAAAERVAVLTGAGISAESGVPTFRDPEGLWERFRPEELANVDAFLKNPELVQAWYIHRRKVVDETHPNAGHVALAQLEALYPHFHLITQNVDGLHTLAGSKNVIELHGNLTRNYCIDCGQSVAPSEMPESGRIQCVACGGLIRPDVVWFGEMLPADAVVAAEQAARQAEVFLTIGTSGVVFPAADLPIISRRSGAYVAEINLEKSAIAHFLDESVVGKAGEILPQLVRIVSDCRNDSTVDPVT